MGRVVESEENIVLKNNYLTIIIIIVIQFNFLRLDYMDIYIYIYKYVSRGERNFHYVTSMQLRIKTLRTNKI